MTLTLNEYIQYVNLMEELGMETEDSRMIAARRSLGFNAGDLLTDGGLDSTSNLVIKNGDGDIIMSAGPAEDFPEKDEYDLIRNMLVQARKSHLELEVVKAFGDEMKSGRSVAEATWNALYEWDC